MVVTRRGICVESSNGNNVSENLIKTAASRSNTPARQRATSTRQTKGEVLSEAISGSEHEGAEERHSQSSEVQSSAVKRMTRSRQARSASQPESMNDADVSEAESCCSIVLGVQSHHDQQLTHSRRSRAPSHMEVAGKSQGEEADISEAESCSSSVSAVQAIDNPRATRSLRSRAVSKAKPGAKSQNEEFSEAESCCTVTSDVQASQNQRTARGRRSEALSLNAEKSQNEDTEVSEAESWCSGLQATVVCRTRSRQAKGQLASESLKKGVTEVEKCSLPSPSKDPEVAVCREQSTSSPKSTRRTSRRNISQSQQEEVISCSESESVVSSVAGSPTRGSCRVESRSEVSETPSSSHTGSLRNRWVVSQPETIVEAPTDHEEMELELPAAASPRKEETKPSKECEEDIQKTADSEGPGLRNSVTVSKIEEQIISEPETTASNEKVEVNDETIVIELDCESINIELADGKSKQGKESVSGYKDADTDSEDENQNQRCRNLLNLETIKASPKQTPVINLLFSSDEGSDGSDRDDSEEEMDDSDVICIQDGEPGPSKSRPSEKHSTQEDGLFVIDTQPGFEPSRKYYLESGTKDSEEEEAESDKEGDQGKESEEEFIDEEEDDEEAEVLYKRRKPALMELSCSIDPGLNLKDIGGLYISFDAKKHKSAPSALKKLKEQKYKDVLLEKSVITPDFEKKESVPPYKESLQRLKMKRREERAKTTCDGWYNMKAPEMTTELKNDLKALKMRSAMDPKRFYKKNDREGFPKYLQVGTVVDSPVDFYHARIPKKQRKRTIVEELMADCDFRSYNKKKYKQIMTEKAALAAGKKNRKKNKFSKKK
ncbi:deoxynucleotidyltransferase terminal-interacting protein 2 [Acipenser oxyrinchus oxyrinchus]|uniref:Deoxynucleotidyltransferase terminal-interacting protein 2 n=1 Tax=Acipenser oxyrinchus oxyrinchus TaxID=40147 RepID=A0AAD8G645_ACIOX|nr:deoxynucleotidyltransferase terminal-interacting protein 2 [Acipenser oxyrinchus oxyrinchus]